MDSDREAAAAVAELERLAAERRRIAAEQKANRKALAEAVRRAVGTGQRGQGRRATGTGQRGLVSEVRAAQIIGVDRQTIRVWLGKRRWVEHGHDARPDDNPEPGDRCKDCGREITWTGPSPNDWKHA